MENDSLNQDALEILKHNGGFPRPEEWVLYAQQHHFKKVPSRKLEICPDCYSGSREKLGQFIYYSNLVCLYECKGCHLVYTDTIIAPSTIGKHFESTYKEERYFEEMRKYVYEEIADIVKKRAPTSGDILDVGGAKGHLLVMVGEHRPDLRRVLNDLSSTACQWASSRYQLKVFCGGFSACEFQQTFDVITMIDVIYYEPDLRIMWDRIASLMKDGGCLIVRVPNKLALIRVCLKLFSMVFRPRRDLQTDIMFLNPEHMYIFSRKYLQQRLAALGFEDVKCFPSAVLVKRPWIRWLYKWWYQVAQLVHLGSLGRFIITPSLTVVARIKKSAS